MTPLLFLLRAKKHTLLQIKVSKNSLFLKKTPTVSSKSPNCIANKLKISSKLPLFPLKMLTSTSLFHRKIFFLFKFEQFSLFS